MLTYVLVSFLACSVAFYLPGVAPRDFADGEPVEIKVEKLDSVMTQLPYDYYSLGFCAPENLEHAAENLGEVLSGDGIQNSPYEVFMQETEECKILCKRTYSKQDMANFAERIREKYKLNWIVDNMPAGTKYYVAAKSEKDVDVVSGNAKYSVRYDKGFNLGFLGSEQEYGTESNVPYVNNHHKIKILYHQDPASYEGSRIVGFEVEPFSVKHEFDGKWKGKSTKLSTCGTDGLVAHSQTKQAVDFAKGDEIIWTYDVEWTESDIKWASRWDLYLKMTDSQIHWFSIVNSIMIVLFLTGMVAMIMMRTLHRDLRRYNELDQMTEEDREEETGWKLIHGDVFRPPRFAGLLSVLVGTGAQIVMMSLVTLIFATLGFLSPANRGGLMTAMLIVFVSMGFFAGYFSTRMYTMFKLTNWRRNAIITALLFPGIVFLLFFIMNMFVWGEKSSGAVPFTTLLGLLAMWFGISVPLVITGAFVAQKREPFTPPVRVNNIPRVLLGETTWYSHPVCSVLVGGMLPFGAVFIEIFFVMSSVWLHRFYYVFGVLAVVFCILVITCAEITVVMCYFQLCNTDYHWWWRSFLTSGASALYLFLYSIMYFFTKLDITGFVPALLFFGYMLLVSAAFFLMTGAVGYYSCFWFVSKIYTAVKID